MNYIKSLFPNAHPDNHKNVDNVQQNAPRYKIDPPAPQLRQTVPSNF
jgi:hypothetical protein